MSFQNEHLTRQLDIIPVDRLGVPITIIGAGAVGSWVTLCLAKAGFGNISVIDHDKVDTVNMNSQFYPFSAIGDHKVDALWRLVKEFTGVGLTVQPHRYESGVFPGLVISAVDSMEVRRKIWEEHKDRAPSTRAIIDPRMGAESALLYVMNPMSGVDQRDYEKTLYSDSQAIQERCTAKATIYTANLLAGLVCKAVKDLAIGRQDHLRTVQWDIGANECVMFNRKPG